MIEIAIVVYLAIGILLLMMVASYRYLIFERMKSMGSSTRKLTYESISLGIFMVVFWAISIPFLKRQAKHKAFTELMNALDEQDKHKHVGDSETVYGWDSGERYDLIEDTPEFITIIDSVRAEADRRLELHPYRKGLGYCHPLSQTIKLILREEHDIHWRTSAEMNPHILYD